MDSKTLITVVLPSAAVGALVSAVITFVGQLLERRSRREEVLLGKAIELAEQHVQLGKDLVLAQKGKAVFIPAINLAAEYYQHLRVLVKTGKLPADFVEKQAANAKALREKLDEGSGRPPV